MRKRRTVIVCRISRTLDQATRIAGGGTPHHAIDAPGSDDTAISGSWDGVRSKVRRREAEYPDDAYRVLSAIKGLDHRNALSRWDLSERMFMCNHRSLEAPVLHILTQCPALGSFDREGLVLHFRDAQGTGQAVRGLLDHYGEFYRHQETEAAPISRPPAVLARIKKLNNPADVLPYDLR